MLIATSRLLALGPVRETDFALRRVLSLVPGYRQHLLALLLGSIRQLADDRALADTLEQLDQLSPELLRMVKNPSPPTPLPEGQRGELTPSPPAHLPPGERGEVAPSAPAPLPPGERGGLAPSPLMGEGWGEGVFSAWDRTVWQSPDAVTLLSKAVERPGDIAPLTPGPSPARGEGSVTPGRSHAKGEEGDVVVAVGFDWLDWQTPPEHPSPAPVGDREPLKDPLAATRHPFWGALVATLDACTGDYPWQSLMLRGPTVRSRHRTLGNAESQLAELWRAEFGLYPARPLIEEPLTPDPSPTRGEGSWIPGRPLLWLLPALDAMKVVGAAILIEGTWRLTDAFRTELMRDDEHMLAFEAIRRRSFRLAQAAERLVGSPLASSEPSGATVAKRASKKKGTGHAVL